MDAGSANAADGVANSTAEGRDAAYGGAWGGGSSASAGINKESSSFFGEIFGELLKDGWTDDAIKYSTAAVSFAQNKIGSIAAISSGLAAPGPLGSLAISGAIIGSLGTFGALLAKEDQITGEKNYSLETAALYRLVLSRAGQQEPRSVVLPLVVLVQQLEVF